MINVKTIDEAANKLEGVVKKLLYNLTNGSQKIYGAKIYFKREDLQEIRSYKNPWCI